MFLFSLKRFCPNCGSNNVHRSLRWGIIECVFLPILLTRPYRCERCDFRFFGLIFAARNKGKKSNPEDNFTANRLNPEGDAS